MLFYFLFPVALFMNNKSKLILFLIEPKHTRKANSTDFLVTRLPADVSGSTHIDLVESQMTSPPKVIELSRTDVPIATATTSTGVTVPLSSSASSTTTTPKQDGSTTLASSPALPKCLNCDYRSSQGTDMVEHGIFQFFFIVNNFRLLRALRMF